MPYLNGYQLHEGGYGCYLKYNSSIKTFELDTVPGIIYFHDYFNIKYINKNMIALNFTKLNKTEYYRRVDNIESELRRILINGKFKNLIDNKTITFNSNGTVNGIDKFSYFEIAYDFACEYQDDVLYLGNDKSLDLYKNSYHYQIIGDTIKIYNIINIGTPENFDYKIGELKYNLIKQ